MNILSTRTFSAIVLASAAVGSLALAGTAFAATSSPGTTFGTFAHAPGSNGGMVRPAVIGTVAAISGDTLTVDARTWQRGGATSTPATTAYTVDATNATVTKANAASSVSAIAVGDMVLVQGTVSGTNVTATKIMDGMGAGVHPTPGMPRAPHTGTTTPIIQGNGEPVIGGSVTAISGSTLTVTAKSGTTYTVDASAATIEKAGAASTLSGVTIGDDVVVQGTVNGTSVTASSVIDQGTATAAGQHGSMPKPVAGFLGAIGGLFTRVFGFF